MKKIIRVSISVCFAMLFCIALSACSSSGKCNHELAKVTYRAATCTENGNVEYWECSLCKKKFSDEAAETEINDVVIPAAHDLSEVKAIDATCTENGAAHHWHCMICQKNFTDDKATAEIKNTVVAAAHKLESVMYQRRYLI